MLFALAGTVPVFVRRHEAEARVERERRRIIGGHLQIGVAGAFVGAPR